MKRLLVVSDSHGERRALQRIAEETWKVYGPVDAYLHCGDGAGDFQDVMAGLREHDPQAQFFQVRGNCDGSRFADLPWQRIVEIGGAKLFLTHGHLQAVKSTRMILSDDARGSGCSIALYGHTHEPCMEMYSVLLLNPGCAATGQYLVLEIRDDGQPRIHLERLK